MYKSQKVAILLTVIFLIIGIGVLIASFKELSTKLAFGSSMLFGIAMIIYRLLRGSCTRIVKYTHMVIHMVAIALLIAAMFLNNTGKEYPKLSGFLVFGIIIIQFLAALFIFTYLYDYRRLRLYFAPFHDIFGIWLYTCVVLVTLTGGFGQTETDIFTNVAFFGFIFIIVIVLSPFFEWELVGNI